MHKGRPMYRIALVQVVSCHSCTSFVVSFLYKLYHVILVQIVSCHFCTTYVMSFLYKLCDVILVQFVSCHSCTSCIMSFLYKFCRVILVQLVSCHSCTSCIMSFLYKFCCVILVQLVSCHSCTSFIMSFLYKLCHVILVQVESCVFHSCTCYYVLHSRTSCIPSNHVSYPPTIERPGSLSPVPVNREEGKTKGTQARRGSSYPLCTTPSLVRVLCQLVQRCVQLNTIASFILLKVLAQPTN